MNDYQPSPTMVPIGKIQPPYYYGLHEYARHNPNLDALVKSVKKHGVVDPIITNSALDLLAGTRRLAAAKQAGLTEVPVIAREGDELIAALRYQTDHPGKPELIQPQLPSEKLMQGLLLFSRLAPHLDVARHGRMRSSRLERLGRTYKGPAPTASPADIHYILDLTEGKWIQLRFFSAGVGAKAPFNPRVELHHNAERAKHYLDLLDIDGKGDKYYAAYLRECRPAGYTERETEDHNSDFVEPKVTAARFVGTIKRSMPTLHTASSTLRDMGGVPEKVTYDELIEMFRELNIAIRNLSAVRERIGTQIRARTYTSEDPKT